MAKKLNIVTLGCSKNLVDSEFLAGKCVANGWDVVFDSDSTEAETVIVNTCGFIGDAKQESIDTILNFAAAKTRGDIERLYVMGCLSQRYADELRAEIPEVDAFFGARTPHGNERLLSTPPHYAYLKISEGCNRKCGFCAIPLIRGPHVSVPMENLVAEAQNLADQGVKELIVIAQDITCYGLDLYGRRALAELLQKLARIESIEWIRLHYGFPAGFPDDVIEIMRCEPKICKYLDIPLQHIAEEQLKAMKRGHNSAETRKLVTKLRSEIPNLALRTTLLVGYPGETERDFEELMEFVRETKFERLGVFPYSAEDGTFSAKNLSDDIPDEVKCERVEHLMALQAEISAEKNAARIGSVEKVIVDRPEGDFWVCRSQWDSPEVDTEILVAQTTDNNILPGTFIDVVITSASEYDLVGVPTPPAVG